MRTWPNIYKQDKGWIVDCGVVSGKRKRIYKSSKSAAEKEATKQRDHRDRGMHGALSISDSDLTDAVSALRLLAGTGITLESLAKKELERGVKRDILISDLYAEYLKKKNAAGLRPRSLAGIKSREGRFSEDLAGISLRELTGDMIEAWIEKCRVNPVSRNAYLRGVKTLLNYAVRQGYILRNPAISVDFVKSRIDVPTVFSTDQVNSVLSWCMTNHPKMTPYFAIGLFAGLRPEEIKRLTSGEINLKDRIITVLPEASKTHMRHVHIQSNLLRWLLKYKVKKSVYWKRYHVDKMTTALGITWPNDVCRKSFISYHLAAFRNQQETVIEAGHRDSTMIFTHYRNIKTLDGQQITSDYASAYWKITPASVRAWSKKQDVQHPETKTETD